jgi:hypothetical protein
MLEAFFPTLDLAVRAGGYGKFRSKDIKGMSYSLSIYKL